LELYHTGRRRKRKGRLAGGADQRKRGLKGCGQRDVEVWGEKEGKVQSSEKYGVYSQA